MDKRTAQRWYDALVSGKYVQCTGVLHKTEGTGRSREERAGYCCLGVLSELIHTRKAVKATGWKWDGRKWRKRNHGSEDLMLPEAVATLFDLEQQSAYASLDEADFSTMNDSGRTFRQIAARIKREWLT